MEKALANGDDSATECDTASGNERDLEEKRQQGSARDQWKRETGRMPVKASEEEPVKETVAEQEPADEKREAQALECEAQPEWGQELERGRQENELEPAQEIERD